MSVLAMLWGHQLNGSFMAGVLCSSSMGHLIQPSKGHSAAAVLNTVLKRGPVTHMLLLTFAAISERK